MTHARLTDERLAILAGAGDERALELLFERHSAALLSFCRHLLGTHEEAEDVLQQTFVRALGALRAGTEPDHLRAWLFTIARNRALSVLSARRELSSAALETVVDTAGLADVVERRSELRAMLADIASLPEPQRAALLLAQLEDFPQRRIAEVLGTSETRVKALVFRARQALMADRAARAVPCGEIRAELAVAHGPDLRRAQLRRHLRQCPACRAFQRGVARQREALACLLPVGVPVGLLARVLTAGGGAAAGAGAGGAVGAGVAGGAGAAGGAASLVKVAVAVVIAGGTAAGGAAITHVASPPDAQAQSAAPAGGNGAPFRVASATVTPTASPVFVATTPVPSAKDAPARCGDRALRKGKRGVLLRALRKVRRATVRARLRAAARLTPAQRRAARARQRAPRRLTPAQRRALTRVRRRATAERHLAVNAATHLTPAQRRAALEAASKLTPTQRRTAVRAASTLTPTQRRAALDATSQLTPAQRRAALAPTPAEVDTIGEAAPEPRSSADGVATELTPDERPAAATVTPDPPASTRRERIRERISGP